MRREEAQVFTPLAEETHLVGGFHESGGYQGATTSTNTIVQEDGSDGYQVNNVSVLSDDGVVDDPPPENFEVEDFGSNVERRMVT